MDDLIGRERERAALEAARGIVLLSGEAGVGKTTLARAALTDPVVGYGVQDGAAAYGPIVEALRALLQRRPVQPPLRAVLAALLPELGAAAAAERATLFEAIRGLIAAAAPVTILLDDMQWADDATLDLLPALARGLEPDPVLLVVAYRSDEVPRGHPVRRLRGELRRDHRLQEIALEPFAPAATARLLERVLGTPPAPADVDAIQARTDGVPFFVAELGLALAAGGTADALPDSLRDAILLRADGLSDAGRRALAVGAVAGQTFAPELALAIAELGDWPAETVARGLLVEAPAGRLAFRHGLVREAIYGEIPRLRRRALHRAVAERLTDASPRALAEHWAQAGEPERARRSFLAAAEASCAVHAYRDGARAARLALELWPEGDDEPGRLGALERMAGCAELSGEPGEAVRAWREVVDGRRRAQDPLALGEATRRLAGALEVQGRWDEALAARESAAAAFAAAGAPADAAAERLAAAAHLRSAASFRAALELLAAAAEDARAADRADLGARIQALEGNVRARMGDGRRGVELVRAALTTALDNNLSAAAPEIYQRLADSLEHGGDYAAARTTYDDAFAFCMANGADPTAQICLACLAVVLRHTGDWERAATVCQEVLASPASPAHARAAAASTRGTILTLRGELRPARALLLEALSIARRIDLTAAEILTTWALAMLDRERGEDASAIERCRGLLERWQRTEERHYTVSPLRWATTLMAEQGDAAAARACAAALARIAADAGQPEPLSALAHALGEIALLDGEAEQAVAQFERALELLRDVGAPFERMESERRAAAALLAAGRRDAAVERLIAAYRLARRLGARPAVRRLAASLGELGESADRRLSRRQAEQLGHAGLTRREVDVLRRLATGGTNREIAQALFLSPRTVDMHVRNILRKLDCRSRADAARRASELDLLGGKHGSSADAGAPAAP